LSRISIEGPAEMFSRQKEKKIEKKVSVFSMFIKRDASLMTCEKSCHIAPHGCRDSIVMNCPVGVDRLLS